MRMNIYFSGELVYHDLLYAPAPTCVRSPPVPIQNGEEKSQGNLGAQVCTPQTHPGIRKTKITKTQKKTSPKPPGPGGQWNEQLVYYDLLYAPTRHCLLCGPLFLLLPAAASAHQLTFLSTLL